MSLADVGQLDNPLASLGPRKALTNLPDPSEAPGFFDDPNKLKFLAQLGALTDPGGAGGVIGGATGSLIERQQLAKAMGKSGEIQGQTLQYLLDALLGESNLNEIELDESGQVKRMKSAPNAIMESSPPAGEPTTGFSYDAWKQKIGLFK